MNPDDAMKLIEILKKLIKVASSKMEQAAIQLRIMEISNSISARRDQEQDPEFKVDTNNFEKAVNKTFELEGFYSDHKFDPGGKTMYGISSKWNPEVSDKIMSQTLTLNEAKEIYRRNYWNKIYRINDLPLAIAWILFDAKVHGTLESVKDIQRWINFNYKKDLAVDGIFGPATFSVLPTDKQNLVDLIAYLSERAQTSAKSAAERVKKQQEKMGLPVYDYTAGFSNRLMERYSFAEVYV